MTTTTYTTLQSIESAIDTLADCKRLSADRTRDDAIDFAYAIHSHQSDLLRNLDPGFMPKWHALCQQVLDSTLAEVLDALEVVR
jgi:hypothetical protein